ncbi:hypothetical protein Q4520_14425 [Alteromonas sp. 1_MG-2023]|uniref:hypothetical protein n=1 Tax=Alteromonas sp. 1_MG-2023 TaxID=3062669 RepID=UPI0026E3C723|nr:hypothetical protein [Alteromonas sp. 1_MG-2023]MDO6476625.1 hypothetical protein [Alteromonas sp. 1_MG-2023]
MRVTKLLAFLQGFREMGNAKVIPQLTGMSVRNSKRKTFIQFRENKKDGYFKLIEYQSDHLFTENDAETILKIYDRIAVRRKAGMHWKNKAYLLSGLTLEIKTFNQLFDHYAACSSRGVNIKLKRIRERYFSGERGDRLLSSYCAESFKNDFLDCRAPDRADSDRNEIIKIISAAVNKARFSQSVQIDVQQLVAKGERSRADKSDKAIPRLSTLSRLILTAYTHGAYDVAYHLLIQLMASTRFTATTKIEWSRVDLKKQVIAIPAPLSKSACYVTHPIPRELVKLFQAECERKGAYRLATQSSSGKPRYIFESGHNPGKLDSQIRKKFERMKAIVIKDCNAESLDHYTLQEISEFTPHRIRDIVEKQLKLIGATDAQKEKCLGRKPDDVGSAYGDLSVPTLCQLKDKMMDKIFAEHPELKQVISSLIDKK